MPPFLLCKLLYYIFSVYTRLYHVFSIFLVSLRKIEYSRRYKYNFSSAKGGTFMKKHGIQKLKGKPIKPISFEEFMFEHPELQVFTNARGEILNIVFPKTALQTSYTIIFGEVVELYYKYNEGKVVFRNGEEP